MAELLPNEILLKIYKLIDGDDLGRCRRVCRRWRDFVGDLNDSVWKEMCMKSFNENYEKEHEKSGLSWKELYKSLSLWSRAKYSRVRFHKNSSRGDVLNGHFFSDFRNFEVLKNGIVTCPHDTHNNQTFNRIKYYDLKHYCFTEDAIFLSDSFLMYAENNNLIVLSSRISELHVITKANKKENLVGRLDISPIFFLFENCVYFRNNDGMICITQLKEIDGNATVETTSLCYLETGIVSVSYVRTDYVNILTFKNEIFSLIGTEMKKIDAFTHKTNYIEIVKTLARHGFAWSNPHIPRWLTQEVWLYGLLVDINKYKDSTIFKHGNVILIGTSSGVLHIYYNPYGANEHMKIFTAEPMKTIDLNAIYPYLITKAFRKRSIQQINVIETSNGHEVVMNFRGRLVVFQLTHDEEDPEEPDS